ncbi:PREDICTED: ADP-ribosylation factor 4 isoform X1 [Myotis davidii]|uniref:ADP-ribosylation factor 4 isoform X1 n=1 Tax=Myotis davidii TaxID=225400 RepID=UPI00076742D9|nr:PREDICTED: ADP-ribosylation factor 4 isoform X1 [Myotis davidii]
MVPDLSGRPCSGVGKAPFSCVWLPLLDLTERPTRQGGDTGEANRDLAGTPLSAIWLPASPVWAAVGRRQGDSSPPRPPFRGCTPCTLHTPVVCERAVAEPRADRGRKCPARRGGPGAPEGSGAAGVLCSLRSTWLRAGFRFVFFLVLVSSPANGVFHEYVPFSHSQKLKLDWMLLARRPFCIN